jgi:hypothetical protein
MREKQRSPPILTSLRGELKDARRLQRPSTESQEGLFPGLLA